MGYETDISTVLLEMHRTFCNKVLRRPVSIERGSGDVPNQISRWISMTSNGTADILTLAMTSVANDSWIASVNWRELA